MAELIIFHGSAHVRAMMKSAVKLIVFGPIRSKYTTPAVKINKTDSPLVFSRVFGGYFTVSDVL